MCMCMCICMCMRMCVHVYAYVYVYVSWWSIRSACIRSACRCHREPAPIYRHAPIAGWPREARRQRTAINETFSIELPGRHFMGNTWPASPPPGQVCLWYFYGWDSCACISYRASHKTCANLRILRILCGGISRWRHIICNIWTLSGSVNDSSPPGSKHIWVTVNPKTKNPQTKNRSFQFSRKPMDLGLPTSKNWESAWVKQYIIQIITAIVVLTDVSNQDSRVPISNSNVSKSHSRPPGTTYWSKIIQDSRLKCLES